MIVYLNANFVIYFVESHPVWGAKVAAHIASLRANGDTMAVSDLTRLECQVGPLKSGNTAVLADLEAVPEVG